VAGRTEAGEERAPITVTSGYHSSDHYNPEELVVAAASSCHMLWYLHLCSDRGIVVVDYRDEPEGRLTADPRGNNRITRIRLRPRVTIASGDPEVARALHHDAHEKCDIANSLNFPVECEPEIAVR